MAHYLIEFRFLGNSKHEIKSLIWEVNKKFHIRPPHRPIPHISLVGPFYTRDEKRLVNDFKELCSKQSLMEFKIEGYDTFENTRVVYININPSKELKKFRWELSNSLKDYCNLKPIDLNRSFSFHATIAMKLSPNKFEDVKKYIKSRGEINFEHRLTRVTLIKNQKILCEYDFLLKRLLNRREAKSQSILKETFRKMHEFIPEEIPEITEKSFSLFRKKRIFFIGDLHLDHANIIKYCNRPFKTTKEMNDTIIKNWNNSINKCDVVYFLGDMSYGVGSRKTSYWLNVLNGNIIFIKGSHDRSRKINFYNKVILNYKDKKFLLVHDPKDIPKDWHGWVIHGHHHNNYPREFPLINKKNKTINVSAEMLNYKPLSIKELLKLIK